MAQAEPLREQIHFRIMQLYLTLDRPLDAIRHYEQVADLLQKELHVEPTASLQALRTIAEERLAHQTPHDSALAMLLHGERQMPLVGRHSQRARLLEIIERTRQGQGSIVFVEGDAGIGKSRLMQEIEEGARWRGLIVGIAQRAPYYTPYAPLREAIATLLTPAILTLLQETLPAHTRAVAAHLWPEFGTPAETLHTHDLPTVITDIVRTLAQHAPLVLVLEDIHTADTALFDVLTLLGQHIETTPCTVILTYRPLDMQAEETLFAALLSLDKVAPIQHIVLPPFDESEKRTFLSTLLQIPLQDPLIHQFATHLSNKPLHIIETVRYLYRRNLLRQTSKGKWELHVPSTALLSHFSPLIADQLEHLPAQHRRVLEALAVFGERIPIHVAVSLLANTTLAVIHDLVRYGFVTFEGETIVFSHALVRESIYQHLAPLTRRTWHRKIASLLRRQPSVPWAHVAHHLAAANLAEEAQHAYVQAAEQALDMHAYEHALALCRAGLALETRNEIATHTLWLLKAQAEKGLGRLQQARSTLASILWKRRRHRDISLRAQVLYEAGQIAWRQGNMSQAVRFYERALNDWHRLEEEDGIVETYIALAEVLKHRGNLEQAIAHLNQALSYIEASSSAIDSSPLYRRALAYKSAILFAQGDFTTARTTARRALDLAQEANDLRIQGFTLNTLARIAIHYRHHANAREYLERALDVAQTLHTPYNEVVTKSNLAVVASNAGMFEESIQLAHRALEQAKHLGLTRMQASLMLTMAWNYTMLGRFRRAKNALTRAKTLIERTDLAEKRPFWLLCQSLWYREQGNLEEAIAYGREALAHEDALGFSAQRVTIQYELGTTLLLAHKYEDALLVLQEGSTQASSPIERAFLEIAATVAQVKQGAPLPAHWSALLDDAQRVSHDEYLPRTWYFVWLATEHVTPGQGAKALHRAYNALQMQALDISKHRHTFLTNVFSHRLITQAWLATAPRPIERLRLLLPRDEGKGDVMVTLTIDAGEEDAIVEAQHGYIALRRHRIRRLLHEAQTQHARLPHKILADILHVSLPTIRRDVQALRAQEHSDTADGTS